MGVENQLTEFNLISMEKKVHKTNIYVSTGLTSSSEPLETPYLRKLEILGLVATLNSPICVNREGTNGNVFP